MKTIGRILGVLGVVVLIVAIVFGLLWRHCRDRYLAEKANREEVVSATVEHFLSVTQANLYQVALAVNRQNFEDARQEMSRVKKDLDTFARLPLDREQKEAGAGFLDLVAVIDNALLKTSPDAEQKIMELVNAISALRGSLKR